MRKNSCKVVRRELDELMLGEACSSAASEHLRECALCREFHEQQTKLRQIVGSLGTVEAPADFDFRLRARLANAASNGSSIYWVALRRGLAVAAMVIVFATGAIVVRNVMNQPPKVDNLAQTPDVHQPAQPDEVTPIVKEDKRLEPVVAGIVNDVAPIIKKGERRPQTDYKKRPLTSIAISSTGAEVIRGTEPVTMSAAFPIEASPQTFRVLLDDGRGNARTISVPTISFGSQRIVQSGNQVPPKRVW